MKAWPELDHSSASALLRHHLAGTETHLTPLGHGDFCLAFRRDGQIVRVARHPEAAAALRREACVLRAIGDTLPLPVPRPRYHSPDSCPPFTTHDEVVGEVLTRDRWMRMEAGAWLKAAADLASFLRALHSVPLTAVLECGLPRLDSAGLARRLGDPTGTLHALLDQGTLARLTAVLARWSEPPRQDRPAVLLHCDIAPGHLLFDPATDSLTGVIDFGDIATGEPARDFIHVYEDYGPAILTEVLSGYAGDDAASLLPEIRKWYLLEATSWTLEARAAGHGGDVEHGLAEIRRELTLLGDPTAPRG